MRYRYYICDVFTETRFGGNQLAVLPHADGLSAEQMQHIAREFNFAESTFVFPATAGHTRNVRIFTPSREVPFAGHPNVGTAFALATAGEFGEIDKPMTVTFEEKAGIVPILIERRGGNIWCRLSAPEKLSTGRTIPVEMLARAVSLSQEDIVTATHQPQVASVGLAFVMVELKSRDALQRARVNMEGIDAIGALGVVPDVHLYVKSNDAFDIRARMFAPVDGVPEDPATGSANAALGALLAHYERDSDAVIRKKIAQGVEMGRPSTLEVTAEKRGGEVVAVHVGGAAVLVSEGEIEAG